MSVYDVFYYFANGRPENALDSDVPDSYLRYIERSKTAVSGYALAVDKNIPGRRLYLRKGGSWEEHRFPPRWWVPGMPTEYPPEPEGRKEIEFHGRQYIVPIRVPEWCPEAKEILELASVFWPGLEKDDEVQYFATITAEICNLIEYYRKPPGPRVGKWTHEQALELLRLAVKEHGRLAKDGFRASYKEEVAAVGHPVVTRAEYFRSRGGLKS